MSESPFWPKLDQVDGDALPSGVQFDVDLAEMALKSSRLEEAQRLYEGVLRNANSPRAWCGLGLVKVQRVMHGDATMAEAMHCFERARALLPANATAVEGLFLNASLALYRTIAIGCRLAAGDLKRAKEQSHAAATMAVLFTLTDKLGKEKEPTDAAKSASDSFDRAEDKKTAAETLRSCAQRTMAEVRTK
ncbi:MAG: hypothetical protein NTW87_12075 [Planctomycetota bacterium]|nr:hypothetical protein [Planctomycetota bacterium]